MNRVILFLIIFLWTPPHFWALSLNRADEYARAGVPMLPVVAGRAATTRQILIYSVALAPISMLPWVLGFAGAIYGVGCRCLWSDLRWARAGNCAGAARPIGEPLIACSYFPFSICSCCLRRS